MTASKNELQAISTVKTFNDLAHRAANKGSETLALIWKAGETAKKAKSAIPHGGWLKFVEQYYDVSHDTVNRWVKFCETVPESKLRNVRNLTAGIKMLDPPKSPTSTSASAPGHGAKTHHLASTDSCDADPSADTGEDGRTDSDGTDAQETAPAPPRNGKAKRGGSSPPKRLDRKAYYRQWDSAIGPLVRLVDKIAKEMGESRNGHHRDVQEHLNDATECMREWMRVEK